MKIFSKQQIYEGDKLTAKKQNITSTELMERAGIQIFNWLNVRMQGAQVPVHVFCGIGNNGGDGLVVARHLIAHGYNVNTYVVNYSSTRSKDFLNNYDRIKESTKKWPHMLDKDSDHPEIHKDDIIIDAIFGIGLNRSVDAWVKQLFQHFRKSEAFTLAIDIPSGLNVDKVPKDENDLVWANYTLSFQAPKLVFFLPETAKYIGQWEVLDIGIDIEYLSNTETAAELIGKNEVLSIYKPREKYSHKGTYGHSLIIGGSHGKIGAVVLSSRAALSIGAGMVTAFVPECGYQIVQTAFPEAMVLTDATETKITNITFDIEPSVIGIGMGMGTDAETTNALKQFLKHNTIALVIDADALNILSKHKELLEALPAKTVLTPHPKELERLIGKWKGDFDKLKKVKAFSEKYDCIVVVKGANSITVYKDKYFVNTTGNPGMATAGTGDVLTGVITGLISQGYEPLKAAIFGIYLHGKSADIAIENLGYQSMIASHIIESLGKAYIDLFQQPEPQQTEAEHAQEESPKQKR
ncbi:NAD(P)H-hydrate dehydratase [Subsaximicrobium wynnwilliamsii]|uniref:Bifunctional NAD(P)H-hydrate repair enzyme n=1 Tax=Subsaximicrobium wynnwilliamsii TaxID=291179 RepID=A0A5C6ZQW4_9FLAO|nr:NAD(P)H-hydrate dehydratase [Subsaximicrobium wynnwilliamsii]TXD85240.1 NAD(P)H-hydrate dehydratase [Subsaximicrobium wynnwilliamsii]TXD91283.1 NAD(P)H-hydrate dehydratase [Subsaximicrobium wynnwilliamsii]TXE04676.1 NAD(P)H-hydrate dehydratase [Subsaximicrobium wynnwilliamsii]